MEMEKFRVCVVVIFSLAFVLALAVVRSEGNSKFLETLFGNRISGISHDELEQETVEQMWIHCWKKIDYNSKIIPDFRSILPCEVEKAINGLPSKAQESLLDCLTRRNLLLEIPNNDPVSTAWLKRLLDFISEFSSVPRRVLKSRNHPRHRHNPHNANLAVPKKHPHQSQKPQTDDLALRKKHLHQSHRLKTAHEKHPHQSHKPETANLALGKKHPHKSHEPKTGDLAPRKKDSHHNHKPTAADSAPRKKHPRQHPEPQTDTFIVHKSPSDSEAKSPNITPSALSASLALPHKPSILAPSKTPTSVPTHVPTPMTIHMSPEQSTPSPSPIPIPPSLDTSPPPLVAKPSPLQVAPDTSPPKSEDDTRRYEIIALVAGAVAMLALTLFLVCCLKRGGKQVDLKERQKDKNPLLNICLSYNSGSEKTHVGENPENKILKTTTVVDNSITNSNTPSLPLSKSPEATQENGNPPPVIPPPPGKKAPPPPSAPPLPPPKKSSAPGPPPPPKGVKAPPAPMGKPQGLSSSGGANDASGGPDSNKAKLKPFFWDKVSSDQSMVWQDLKAGSFQVDEEMMETLFGYTVAEKTKNDEGKGSSPYNSPQQYIKIIDPKKAQNLSIMLKALNVTTEEVCDALTEGNELPSEIIQNLSKMAPTSEEELKLRLYNDHLSLLGPAERFLKSVVDIPFAFRRMESLLFMSSVQEEVSSIKDSFKTLEVACAELKNSKLFLKLLEAVLKTGNRMNDGTYRGDAQAFKLDTLLKLSDVKGADGKTTLLHFVVQEIIRSEGVRAARTLRESQSMSSVKSEDLNDDAFPDTTAYYRSLGLNVVSNLSSDLENVRKAALIDGDGITNSVYKLGQSLEKIKDFLENEVKGLEEESEFQKKLEEIVGRTEDEIKRLVREEKRVNDLVKGTVDYFHGKGAKNEGLRLFVIVADFLVMLDKACKDVRIKEKTPVRPQRTEGLSPSTSSDSHISVEPIDIRQRLFPTIMANRRDDSSSDDESFSP